MKKRKKTQDTGAHNRNGKTVSSTFSFPMMQTNKEQQPTIQVHNRKGRRDSNASSIVGVLFDSVGGITYILLSYYFVAARPPTKSKGTPIMQLAFEDSLVCFAMLLMGGTKPIKNTKNSSASRLSRLLADETPLSACRCCEWGEKNLMGGTIFF